MNALLHRIRRRSRSAGQGLVEYALLLALIAIIVVGSLKMLGSNTNQKLGQVNCTMEGKEWQTDSGNQNSSRCR
jgi:pilus assembly protein Flp/PilA